jgi:hypothetical protein
MRRLVTFLGSLAMVTALVASIPAPAAAAGGEGETWPAFTESSSCGAQRITTPLAEAPGGFGADTLLRGPYAEFFGRTVQQVRDQFVPWRIPGSSVSLNAHERMLPALDLAQESLEDAIAAGNEYRIRGSATSATAARTIAGTVRISRHTFGIAFDFNSDANPYRDDNTLITDMPPWWIESFLEAGFCWGGTWIGSKDAMHYAWKGPAFSGYDRLPLPYEPLTDPVPLTRRAATVPIAPQAVAGTFATLLVDIDTNAAVDIVRLVETDQGVLIDSSVASRGHNACSSRRSLVAGLGSLPERALAIDFGDWDGLGGNDLWLVTDERGSLRLTVRWAFGGYAAETSVVTGVPTPSPDAWISTADWDVDGSLDLFVIDEGSLDVWAIDPDTGVTELLHQATIPTPDGARFLLGDVDIDNRPDLWTLTTDEVFVAPASDGYASNSSIGTPTGLPSRILDAAASDYDGDGRPDLVVFDGAVKHVWLGNTRLADGLPLETWFEYPDSDCEAGERTWQRSDLRYSRSGWVAEGSYEWRRANGFPTGCDPEDETCRPPLVTKSAFLEFLAWIDGLDARAGDSRTAAARAVTAAGYPTPCAPQDRQCLSAPMLMSDVSSYFGQFLAARSIAAPQPHRWIVSEAVPRHSGPS